MIRRLNRAMVGFDLALGTAALAAPEPTLPAPVARVIDLRGYLRRSA